MLISLIFIAGCKQTTKDKLIGKWKLESLEGEDMKNIPDSYLEFKDDGTVTEGMKDRTRDYSWKLSEDETELIIVRKEKERKLKILTLDETTFIFQGENGKATLKKE